MATFLKAVSFLTNNTGLVEVLLAEETLFVLLSDRPTPVSPLTSALCYSSSSMKKQFFSPALQTKMGHNKCFTLRVTELDLICLFINYANYVDGRGIVFQKYKSVSSISWIRDQN